MAAKREPLTELNLSNSNDQPKRKHVTVSIVEKVQILDRLLGGTTVSAISQEFGVARTTVLNFKKREDAIRIAHQKFLENGVKERRTVKTAKLVTLEDCLFVWILQERLKRCLLLPDIVRMKAGQMFQTLKQQGVYDEEETFTASNGWYDRFRKRYGLKIVGIKGECASSDTAALEKFKARLVQLIIDKIGLSMIQLMNQFLLNDLMKGEKKIKKRLKVLIF